MRLRYTHTHTCREEDLNAHNAVALARENFRFGRQIEEEDIEVEFGGEGGVGGVWVDVN